MMQFAHGHLRNIPGLRFYKLLGTGAGNGFSLWPDFSVYAFLAVWEDEKHAGDFMRESVLFRKYRRRSAEIWTFYMKVPRSHGYWSGQEPFIPQELPLPGNTLGIITRATIDRKHLRKFWKHVPVASAALRDREGLVISFGIGEVPVIQMATFSLWKDEASMQEYAYRQQGHLEAIKKTREFNWYTEELFARFRPVKTEGTWGGTDPLSGLL